MENITFRHHLVLKAITQGNHTLPAITCSCSGIYPGELQELLNQLIELKQICLIAGHFYLISEESRRAPTILPFQHIYDVNLPEPHPHDFDWRFDSKTVLRIAEIALRENVPHGSILTLGTPSVFLELLYSYNAPHAILMDWSPALIAYLQRYQFSEAFDLVLHNVFSEQLWNSKRPMDVVVIDPPWYIEHYTAFLTQATHVSRVGARMIVSMLPTNTKPEALAERWIILETTQKLGWHLRSLDCGGIHYQTPPFEHASLDSMDHSMPTNWREGDLAIFEKFFHPDDEAIRAVIAAVSSQRKEQDEWGETFIGRYKIKLRGPFQDYQTKPELLSIEPGDILPTVSRRYKGREFIDLWLWNNQVFAVKGKVAFLAALYVLSNQSLPDHLHAVSTEHLDLALAALLSQTRIGNLQIGDSWKETRYGRKQALVSLGVYSSS
jgi:hypothetical protein